MLLWPWLCFHSVRVSDIEAAGPHGAGGSIWSTIVISVKPVVSHFDEYHAAPIIWLLSSAIADLLITGVLIYSLVGT